MADENNNIEQKISLTYDTNAETTAGEVQQLNTAIDNTTQSQNENTKANENNEKAQKSLKLQLREAVLSVQALTDKYGANSREAVQAARKAAELKDKIEDANDAIQAFKGEGAFIATTKALSATVSGFAAVQGGLNLLGVKSEETEQAILKIQSAMALAQGLEGLEDAGRSFSQLKTVIASSTIVTAANTAATTVATYATKLFGVTAETTAVGFKVLKGAIIATGIGALGIAIVALIQNFDSIKSAILNTIPGLKGISETIGNIVQSVTDFVGATSEADRQLDLAKSKAKQQLELNKKYLQEHESQLNEVTKKKIEAKNKYLEVVAEEGKATAEFARETNRQIAKADADAQAEKEKKAKEAQDKINEKRKQELEKEKAEAKKKADEEKKAKEDFLKSIADLEQKYLIENQNLNAKTDQEKLDLQAQRDLDEILAIQKKGGDIANLMALYNEKYIELQDEQDAKVKEETAKKDEEKAVKDKEKKDKEIADEQALADAKLSIQNAQLDNVSRGIGLLQSLGIKNKAIQKGLVIAENAAGIAKTVINTMAANAKALTLGPVLAPPTILANNISAGIGIATSVAATAKALSALGGGGGGSSSTSLPSGGGGGASATPTVGFQTSSENQIATTIASNQQEQPPIKAFVVSTEVSTAQAIDRNKVTANSLGGG